jgi:hypothetical protein
VLESCASNRIEPMFRLVQRLTVFIESITPTNRR